MRGTRADRGRTRSCATVIGITRLVCKPSPQGEEQQLHAQYNNHPEIEQYSDVIPFSTLQSGARRVRGGASRVPARVPAAERGDLLDLLRPEPQ